MIDHADTAEQLDRLYSVAAALDLQLARAGFSSWHSDSPRRASLAVLEHLGGLRAALDAATVAAGCDPAGSPYYLMRALQPNTTTRAAARRAIRESWPYSTEEHDNIGRVHRRAGRLGDAAGPGCEKCSTGDEDRPPSLHETPAQGPAASALAVHGAPACHHDHDDHPREVAPSESLAQPQTV